MELLILPLVGLYTVSVVVSFRKGKTVFGWLGIAGFFPLLTFFLAWFPIVGALRLAKPDSPWARDRYDEQQMAVASLRFGRPAQRTLRPIPAARDRADATHAVSSAARDHHLDSTTAFLSEDVAGSNDGPGTLAMPAAERQAIKLFLARARRAGSIDAATYRLLLSQLRHEGAGATIPPPAEPVASPRQQPAPRELQRPTTPSTTLGSIIRDRRFEKRLSVEQLAAEVGHIPAAVHRWERNDVVPPPVLLDRLASALDLDPNALRDAAAATPDSASPHPPVTLSPPAQAAPDATYAQPTTPPAHVEPIEQPAPPQRSKPPATPSPTPAPQPTTTAPVPAAHSADDSPPPSWLPARPAESPTPRQPSIITTRLAGAWDKVAADVALHGFAYFGVLLTVVGVLGFLLFAFVDVPDQAQPIVELFIAVVFFGWAWALRRQDAHLAANAMEFVGWLVVPLTLFASLVDGAPVPPDFEDGALIAALTISALLLAGGYAWFSRRASRPTTARFLVAPLVWLAAMSLGFVFKSDEPLFSDAITRLVPEQPALAAAAVAATVALARWRPQHALSGPAMWAAVVGLPSSYLLTLSLVGSGGWQSTLPLVVAGAAAFISVEWLGDWFEKSRRLAPYRPLLLAWVLLPLIPTMDLGWAGLVVVASYIVLAETGFDDDQAAMGVSIAATAGAVAGGVMTVATPWSALLGYSVLSAWTLYRASRHDQETPLGQVFVALATVTPIGIGWAISQLIGSEDAWLVMAAILLCVGVVARRVDVTSRIFAAWTFGAAAMITTGAVFAWIDAGFSVVTPAVAVLLTAGPVWLGRRWEIARLWAGSSLVLLALAMGLEATDYGVGPRSVVWAVLGFVLVGAATLWRRRPSGHLATIGHLVAFGALFMPWTDGQGAIVAVAWAGSWVVSVVASLRDGDSFTGVLTRVAADASAPDRLARAVSWIAPTIMAISIPPAVISLANTSAEFVAHRSWTGLTVTGVAVAYALGRRPRTVVPPVSTVLGIGAMAGSLIGVAVAAPDSWPTIVASLGIIAVAGVLDRTIRSTGFVWLAWLMSFVIAILLAERAGIDPGSLHLVSLVWSVILTAGGLVVDDVRSGRRQLGEGLRTNWLRFPVLLGALAIPVSLAPAFTSEPAVYGWWALGAAAGYLVVAWLLRAGSVGGAAYALLTLAAAALSPWSLHEEPWRLVVISAALVALSWVFERMQSPEVAREPWLRWDLAPQVVALVVAGYASVLAVSAGDIAATSLALAVVSLALALKSRSRLWGEVGNAFMLVAAFDAGGIWPTLVLAATAVRGVTAGVLTTGVDRWTNHVIGAVAAGVGWLTFVGWLDLSLVDAVSVSGLVWGGFLLALAVAARLVTIDENTLWIWGILGVVAMTVIGVVAIDDVSRIAGPWLAISYVLVAVASEIAAPVLDRTLHLAPIPLVGIAWLALITGLDWATTPAADITAVTFGALAWAAAEATRRLPTSDDPWLRHRGRAWAGLGATGVTIATLTHLAAAADTATIWPSIGLALLTTAAIRGADPFGVGWLRDLSGVLLLATVTSFWFALGWPDQSLAVTVIVAAGLATVGALVVWARGLTTAWLRPLIVLGLAANLEALVFALVELPARALFVVVLLAWGIQAVAIGLIQRWWQLLALGPPLIGASFLLAIWDAASGSAQWYTVPLGLVLLAEVEIYRYVLRANERRVDSGEVVGMEWAGIGFIVAPSLVEMFVGGLGFGLVAFAGAAAFLLWAIVTRVRRRVVAAASVAVTTAVLMIAAAAAAGAPTSAFFWVLAIGIGFAVMLVAALIEAYRSRKGELMIRADRLMEGWE